LRNAVGLFDYKMDKIKFVKDSGSNILGGLGIGANALKNFDTAAVINSANIAIGYNAGSSLPKNSSPYHNNDNVFIGIASGSGVGLKDANGAGQNVMIGNYTGNYVNPQAYGNVVIGHEAGRFSFGTITGKNPAFNMNIAIGGRSLQYARVAENNISIGPDNLNRSTDVSRNISIGGFVASDFNGDDNVIIGSEMFRDVKSSGNRNIYIGSKISKEINGNGNIVLGYMAADDTLFKSISNKLIVSNTSSKTPLILGDFMTQSIEINGDLKVTGKFIQTSNSDTTIKFDRSENIFIDKVSLTKNKTGFGNIALGLNTLTALDSGSNNIAIGRNALSKMVVGGGGQGSESVAIGFNALMNSVGNGNTVLGKSAMQDATTASWNTAIGQHALQSNITGSSNVSIGYASMIQSSANASNNVVIGRGSGERLNSSNNVGIGYQSLWSTTSGADNISIGSLAGYSLTTGSNNIIIGSNTQLPAANTSNTILIGNNATLNSEIKGRLKTNGMALALVTVTGEYSAKISDEVILCDAETNPFTITLPNAVENSGQVLTIKKINSNSNSITINSFTSQKIDGSSTFLLSTQYAFIKVISNGANWFVIGN